MRLLVELFRPTVPSAAGAQVFTDEQESEASAFCRLAANHRWDAVERINWTATFALQGLDYTVYRELGADGDAASFAPQEILNPAPADTVKFHFGAGFPVPGWRLMGIL